MDTLLPALSESRIIIVTLCASLLLVAEAAAEIVARKGIKAAFCEPMGSPDWDFGKSWATNIAVFGAILGAVLQAKELFKPTPELLLAALFFAFLVVVSPLVFLVARWGGGADKQAERRGCVGAFLISCVLTGWASLGQVALLYFASSSISTDSMARSMFQGLTLVTFLLLALHINRSSLWTALSQGGKTETVAKAPIEQTQPRTLSRWPLP